jgi:hypothetical protein
MWAFYLAWLVAFVHAAGRPRQTWSEQCAAIAALAVTAVTLNWLTTGDHHVRTLRRRASGVAGMDLVLLAGAGLALVVARRLRRRSRPAVASAPA